MSKRLILDPSDDRPVAEGEPLVPKLRAIRPFGSTLLVEMLNADEALGTRFYVSNEAQTGAPQAYIVELGPKLSEDVGLKPGDRVMLQGSYVPVPNFDNNNRKRGIVELHNVKAILEEDITDENS